MTSNSDTITLFLCGDVMTGRGIDQVLANPCDPVIYERYMKSAKGYVRIAEQKNGRIAYPVGDDYIWGHAARVLAEKEPDLRLINLETAVTVSDDHWKNKGINYRMNPANIGCLKSAGIDYCSLANNHVLDWGYRGLAETMATLDNAGIKFSGAGSSAQDAARPAVFGIGEKGRVLVFAFGFTDSGIPREWAAGNRPGVNLFRDYSPETVKQVKSMVNAFKKEGDVVVASVHWGGNWGYGPEPGRQRFARQLIDVAGVDIIHGHSSHHVKGIEVYRDRLILYGCGDFLNDYEGISGHEAFRGDLGLMYFVKVEAKTGKLLSLEMTPTKIRNFRVNRARKAEVRWLYETLNREGRQTGTRVGYTSGGDLVLQWD